MGLIDYIIMVGLFLLAMLLASCTPEYRDLCDKGETTPGVVCLEIYQPVLAPDGTTYPNSCLTLLSY